MKTILVVNGERDWQRYLPGCTVIRCRLQTSKWLYHQGKLWVFDEGRRFPVDGVLWRVGAIKPQPQHRSVLELIRMAGVPCVNSVEVLLRCHDRLSMLNELRKAGLPMMDFTVALGEQVVDKLTPEFPAIVKVGNFHGGFGKMYVQDRLQWADTKDMLFVTDDYATIEPYIDYAHDIRCLAVRDQIWAMSRRGTSWKANTDTVHYGLIEVPPKLRDYTERAMSHFQADVLGLDFLEQEDGSYICLESNDIPGLSGFPDEVRQTIANTICDKISA